MSVRVGIVGTGWGVKTQVPAFRRAGLNVVALCGRDLAKTQKLAQELRIPHAFNDWNHLVQHKEVDVVSVVTPPDTHASISIAALKAGKHVLCDKPTALDRSEALAMAEAAKGASGQIAWIDHELRFLQTVKKMKESIHDPAFGRIVSIELRMLSNFNNLNSFTWWHQSKSGGGALGAVGSHAIDLATYLTGQKVVSVQATTAALKKQIADEANVLRDVTADHYVSGSLRYSGGAEGSILITSVYPTAPERRVTIVGEKRVAILNIGTGLLTVTEGRDEIVSLQEPIPSKQETGMEENVWCTGSILIGQALKEAVLARQANAKAAIEDLACPFTGGVYVQEVLDAIRKSSATGSTVHLQV